MRASALALLAVLGSVFGMFGSMACTDDDARPQISTQGLGQPCPSAGCITGQVCVTAAAPGGETRSCEIQCSADRDCPGPLICNLPPIVPDSLARVCVVR